MQDPPASLDKLIIIGDRILIKPRTPDEKTRSGLYLPPGVLEKEKIQSGYVMKIGPGYPIPVPSDESESWKQSQGHEPIKYIPLQPRAGDLAIFLQKEAYEVMYQGEKYYIVSQHSILMLERDEALFE
ncbi:MAG: co-chaperone GroES family protein [Bacteroidota bacterium]